MKKLATLTVAALMLGLTSVANATVICSPPSFTEDLILKKGDDVGDVTFTCSGGFLNILICTTPGCQVNSDPGNFVLLNSDGDAADDCTTLVNTQGNYVPGSGVSFDSDADKRGAREQFHSLSLDLSPFFLSDTIGVVVGSRLFQDVDGGGGRPFATATAEGVDLFGNSGHHCVTIFLEYD